MASGIRLTQEEAEKLVANRCLEQNYTYKPFTYVNTKTILELKCDNFEHEEWKCKFSKFIYKRTGCPECKGRNSLKEKTARTKVHEICELKGYTYEPFDFKGAIGTKIIIHCGDDSHKPHETNYNSLVNKKNGCIECGGKLKLTQQHAELNVINICNTTGYTYKPFEYKNNRTKITLKCCNPDHDEFSLSYDKFVYQGNGCVKCGNQSTARKLCLSQDESIRRLNEICTSKGYTYKPFIYKNVHTLITLKCSECEHPEWTTRYQNIVQKQRGCPSCSRGGYDPSKPGYFYIHRVLGNGRIYYKFGITNNYIYRFEQYNKNLFRTEKYKIYYSTDGILIKELEYFIKHMSGIKRKVIDKINYLDGYTETINDSEYEKLIKIIESYNVQELDVNSIK